MKAVIKNVTTNNNNDDLISFAQTIDFSELFEHIKAFTGVNCSFHQPEITTNRGNVLVSFVSDYIINQIGPFAAILESCHFCSFNNGVFKNSETDDIGYGVTVNISYMHKDGDSNGMGVTHASYTKRTGWVFRNVGMQNAKRR